MTICVVGGTGFLGKHLCQALERRCVPAFTTSRTPDRLFLSHQAPSIAAVALEDPHLWDLIATAKAIIHLGSSSKPNTDWRSPAREIEGDVVEAVRLVRRVLDVNPTCHIIYASSGGTIYGPGYRRPITEDDAVSPTTSYALGRQMIEQALRFYAAIECVSITVMRVANPVGVWQLGSGHGLISALINSALTLKAATIYGDGKNVRDYFDADDLADAFIDVALSPRGRYQIFNVSSGQGRTEMEIVDLVERVLQRKLSYNFQPQRPFDLQYAVLDSRRIADAYGWRPKTSLEDTVRKMALAVQL